MGIGVSIQSILTLGNGYLLTGWKNNNPSDVLIIKTDNSGDTLWSRKLQQISDAAYSSVLLGSYGYLIGGYSNSFNIHSESYLIKIDTSGNLIWQKTYSGFYAEQCKAVKYRPGFGYILAGSADGRETFYIPEH